MSTVTERCVLDFETRSELDIKYGAWAYSRHPSTKPLCINYTFDGKTAKRWIPSWMSRFGLTPTSQVDEMPQDLREHIEAGGMVEAHNALFEAAVWTNIMVRKYGWPEVPQRQWDCTAARAAILNLPRDLDTLTRVLKTRPKDKVGASLIKKVCKPIPAWVRTGKGPKWHEDKATFERIFTYCDDDCFAEWDIGNKLPPLRGQELDVYHMDFRMNRRGWRIDREGIEAAIKICEVAKDRLNAELAVVTKGEVTKGTQRARLLGWINHHGKIELSDTRKLTLERGRRLDVPARVKRAMKICTLVNQTSTAKYPTMLLQADPEDDAIRDLVMYAGANTARWTAKGVQVHNLPRGFSKNMAEIWELVRTGDIDLLDMLSPMEPMETLSKAIRGAFIAREGKLLYVADYAAIEARLVLWFAGAKAALKVFEGGGDIYMAFATDVYEYEVNDKVAQADERYMGKQGILGLGFGMGVDKFISTLDEKYDIIVQRDFAELMVVSYRQKSYPEVPRLWKAAENAAFTAMQNPNKLVPVAGTDGKLHYVRKTNFLYCVLPSGRRIPYPFPELRQKRTSWGEMKLSLTYMGIDQKTKKWVRQSTYGGKLTENFVQSTARDLLAHSMLEIDASSVYEMTASVHDEDVAEGPLDGDADHFTNLVATKPDWAATCPIAAEGWRAERYRK